MISHACQHVAELQYTKLLVGIKSLPLAPTDAASAAMSRPIVAVLSPYVISYPGL